MPASRRDAFVRVLQTHWALPRVDLCILRTLRGLARPLLGNAGEARVDDGTGRGRAFQFSILPATIRAFSSEHAARRADDSVPGRARANDPRTSEHLARGSLYLRGGESFWFS